MCSISSFCDHLLEFKDFDIIGNAVGCNSREEILESCDNYVDCTIESPDYHSGFDVWNENNLPDGWNGVLDTSSINGLEFINIIKENPINDIEGFSVNLTTISYSGIGSLVGGISFPYDVKSQFVDIGFEYCFADPGINSSSGKGSLLIDNIEFWNTGFTNSTNSPCANAKEVNICNIPVTASDSIQIKLRNNFYSTANDGTSGSSWIIDNFKLEYVMPNGSSDQVFHKEEATIYPNPVHQILTLDTDVKYDHIRIFNLYQRKMMDLPYDSTVNVSDLSAGVYFLVLIKDDSFRTMKFIKSD